MVDFRLYRQGISMIERDPEKDIGEEIGYFGQMEEAIVSEATERLYQSHMRTNLLFRDEIQQMDELKHWMRKAFNASQKTKENPIKKTILRETRTLPTQSREELLAVLKDNRRNERTKIAYLASHLNILYKKDQIGMIERDGERKKFNGLIDRIWERSQDQFGSKDDIFDAFARANFTGRYMAIAHVIEGALGNGSFRRVANEFADFPGSHEKESANPPEKEHSA